MLANIKHNIQILVSLPIYYSKVLIYLPYYKMYNGILKADYNTPIGI